MSEIHNLDDSVVEYFEFTVKGHTYRFRHMNTDEMDELKKIEDDDEKSKQFLYSFIEPVGEAPDWNEVARTLTVPHWIRFRTMIEKEFSGE